MSGDKRIYITVDSTHVDELKAEIKEFIIGEVDSAINKKMHRKRAEEERQRLEGKVQDVFRNGANLSPQSNTGRNNSTKRSTGYGVRSICEECIDGEWVSGVKVKVILVKNEEDPEHKVLQKGVMELDDGFKFKYMIWRKSGLKEFEVEKEYQCEDLVSSVYDGEVEMQFNSQSVVYELTWSRGLDFI